MNVYDNIKSLDFDILPQTAKGGIYESLRLTENGLAYISGTGCNQEDYTCTGKVGSDLTIEEGITAAKRTAQNIISNLHHQLGDLNKIKRLVKMLVFVASDTEFTQQPQVADGACEVFEAVFGSEKGLAARSAIGVSVLPGNIPVEIELIFELAE